MSRVHLPAVYILASRPNGTIYTGVTSDLVRRIWEHKNDVSPGFTREYQVHTLVYYEIYETMYAAISREQQIKAGSRAKKVALICAMNNTWRDLYPDIL